MTPKLLLTCEHGGNRVPQAYRRAFRGAQEVLATHRGLDIGALAVGRGLAADLGAPLVFSTVTRLLVDLNRSSGHPRQFSEFCRHLSVEERAAVAARYYTPYRTEVESRIAAVIARRRRLVHVSIHSFTPRLFGETRNAEIGLLYDPRRPIEARGASTLHRALLDLDTGFRIRRNYPYTGVSDGFQPYLRRRFATPLYAAFEIEMNQAVVATPAGRGRMRRALAAALATLLAG